MFNHPAARRLPDRQQASRSARSRTARYCPGPRHGPDGRAPRGTPGRNGTAEERQGNRQTRPAPAAAPLLRAAARPGGARLGTAGPPPGQPPGHPRRSRKRLENGSVAQWPSGKRGRETEEETGGESPSVSEPRLLANPLGHPRRATPPGHPAICKTAVNTRRSYRSHERPCPPVACRLPARCRRGAGPSKERGNRLKATRHPFPAKLTLEQAELIRKRYAAGEAPGQLASEYGIAASSVYAVVHERAPPPKGRGHAVDHQLPATRAQSRPRSAPAARKSRASLSAARST